MTPNELRTLKSRALDYLVQEWPVLDKRCESITNTVVLTSPDGCAIAGEPRRDGSCEPASHLGYVIFFDKETLNPTSIRWLSEPEPE